MSIFLTVSGDSFGAGGLTWPFVVVIFWANPLDGFATVTRELYFRHSLLTLESP